MHGPRLLAEWREREGLNRLGAAKLLGVDWGGLRDWENADARPGLDAVLKMEEVCGIPAAAWREVPAAAAKRTRSMKPAKRRTESRRTGTSG